MYHLEEIIDGMTDLETDLLMPYDIEAIEGYLFELDHVHENGWFAYITLPDDSSFGIEFDEATGKTTYDKETEAFYEFETNAKTAFPIDSCAIDTASAFLFFVEMNGWYDE